MKKIIILILLIVFVFSGCTVADQNAQTTKTTTVNTNITSDYVKSVWITYYELSKFTLNKSAEDFKKSIDLAFKELSCMGFNTVTVQIRPCADAFYMSNYYPSSKYCFGTQGNEMLYDPLKIMCEVAIKHNLSLEAWINPYRVSQDNNIDALCETNIAKLWYNDKSKKTNIYIAENSIYFNPASQDVIDLIVNGVVEIVKNYNITAIHFDDYFYPTTKEDIDSAEYKSYKSNGGKLSLNDWRRENVNTMIKTVYKEIKNINSKVKFGISPAGDIDKNYSTLYADVQKWSTQEGYIDYICPQIYFGFNNESQPFMLTTKSWLEFCKKDMYVGLPLYKSGVSDKYASQSDESAINEFIDNNDVISRQITYLSKLSDIKGFYVFSYSYLFDDKAKAQVENMLKVMQSNNQD